MTARGTKVSRKEGVGCDEIGKGRVQKEEVKKTARGTRSATEKVGGGGGETEWGEGETERGRRVRRKEVGG